MGAVSRASSLRWSCRSRSDLLALDRANRAVKQGDTIVAALGTLGSVTVVSRPPPAQSQRRMFPSLRLGRYCGEPRRDAKPAASLDIEGDGGGNWRPSPAQAHCGQAPTGLSPTSLTRRLLQPRHRPLHPPAVKPKAGLEVEGIAAGKFGTIPPACSGRQCRAESSPRSATPGRAAAVAAAPGPPPC
jgi:hypothetical protein